MSNSTLIVLMIALMVAAAVLDRYSGDAVGVPTETDPGPRPAGARGYYSTVISKPPHSDVFYVLLNQKRMH